MENIYDESISEISTKKLYQILRLRVDIFVVEQNCPYPELDGVDIDSGTRHIWIEKKDLPISYLRVFSDTEGETRIGRVATIESERTHGFAGILLDHVIKSTSGTLLLDAQVYLENWYHEKGFVTTGKIFEEPCGENSNPGILHVPMSYKRNLH